jgi:hypothetical protein
MRGRERKDAFDLRLPIDCEYGERAFILFFYGGVDWKTGGVRRLDTTQSECRPRDSLESSLLFVKAGLGISSLTKAVYSL